VKGKHHGPFGERQAAWVRERTQAARPGRLGDSRQGPLHDVVSWIAPDVARIDEPFTGPERGILDGFLDGYRATLLWKCARLTGEQLALAPVPPSNLSLLGIVRHMADVERAWFRIRFRGEPPSDSKMT
jgi:hypothetical protein